MTSESHLEFGCEVCAPENPEEAWAARQGLTRTRELIDESHFIVAVLICAACNQARISVFVEDIDWSGGNDPQHWTILPVTANELAEVVDLDEHNLVRRLSELGTGRICLHRDFPREGPIRLSWAPGVVLP